MNLLPKKSWHVNNVKNKERVLKDEREHAIENELKEIRMKSAEREALWSTLGSRSNTMIQTSETGLSNEPIITKSMESRHNRLDCSDMSQAIKASSAVWYAQKKSDNIHSQIVSNEDPITLFCKPASKSRNDSVQSTKSGNTLDELRQKRLSRERFEHEREKKLK